MKARKGARYKRMRDLIVKGQRNPTSLRLVASQGRLLRLWFVICESCLIRGTVRPTQKEAIEAWNNTQEIDI